MLKLFDCVKFKGGVIDGFGTSSLNTINAMCLIEFDPLLDHTVCG